jgi:hypothetical protein
MYYSQVTLDLWDNRSSRGYSKVESLVSKVDCCYTKIGEALYNQSFWFPKRNQKTSICVCIKAPDCLNVNNYFITPKFGGGYPYKVKQNMSAGQIWLSGTYL